MPWSMLGATTIPFLGASGSSVHLAGIHLGMMFHVPLRQTTLPLWLGWNCGTHLTSTDWLWPEQYLRSSPPPALLQSNLPRLEPLALSWTNPFEMYGTTQGAETENNYIRSVGPPVQSNSWNISNIIILQDSLLYWFLKGQQRKANFLRLACWQWCWCWWWWWWWCWCWRYFSDVCNSP